jgi:hypothetical protein
MEPYAQIRDASPFAASADLFTILVEDLQSGEAAGLTACELEDLLAERGREVQRQLLQDHLDLRAAREEQAVRQHHVPATGADGITRNRVETGHGRLLATLFGTVQVTRCAWRRPGAPSLCPADAALSLPACRPSHALARLAAVEAVRGSFEAAHAAITRRCGPVMGKRQVEQAVVSAACDIAAFYAARIPVPCTASTLLVLSADAKGIVMRPQALRPKTARAAARQGRMRTRLTPGEKPCRKRMATLACVYDTEPSPRRPHDIIAPPGGRHGHRTLRPRPRATGKWLAGSVRHDPAEVIAAAFSQAEAREAVEVEGFGGGGVVAAAFGDVQVAGVFYRRGDGCADGGEISGSVAGPAGGGVFAECHVADVVVRLDGLTRKLGPGKARGSGPRPVRWRG